MRIADVVCPACGTSYEMAEALSVEGQADHEDCSVCGQRLASWTDHRLKAFRLAIPAEHNDARAAT
jgi:Zn ribbon nucleic-acid-binding protein